MSKNCTKCGENKPLSAFSRSTRDGSYAWCKPCASSYSRKFLLAKRYSLTPEQYDDLNVAQNGRCALCERPRPLCVDHDHDTGAVRGLLCQKCNKGIGLLDDDPDVLARAMEYV